MQGTDSKIWPHDEKELNLSQHLTEEPSGHLCQRGPLNLPHRPKKQTPPTAWTSTKSGKTKTQSHFPGHGNKGQVPRANNEATRMGKVECWSETETQKSNKWAVVAPENKTLMDHRRVGRHIKELRFPKMHVRAQEYYWTGQLVWKLGTGKYLF